MHGEGNVDTTPQLMAYIHLEQMLGCLGQGESTGMAEARTRRSLHPCAACRADARCFSCPQRFPLPCTPQLPEAVLANPGLACYRLVLDFNTIDVKWLGSLGKGAGTPGLWLPVPLS